MRALSFSLLAAGAAALALAGAVAARPAPDTLTLDLKVNPTGANAVGYYHIPQMLKLGKDRPAGIKKTPAFKGTVSYGRLSFGDAKDSHVIFALDQPADRYVRPRADVFRDVFLVDVLLEHPLPPLKLGEARLLLCCLLFQLGQPSVLHL